MAPRGTLGNIGPASVTGRFIVTTPSKQFIGRSRTYTAGASVSGPRISTSIHVPSAVGVVSVDFEVENTGVYTAYAGATVARHLSFMIHGSATHAVDSSGLVIFDGLNEVDVSGELIANMIGKIPGGPGATQNVIDSLESLIGDDASLRRVLAFFMNTDSVMSSTANSYKQKFFGQPTSIFPTINPRIVTGKQ